MLGAAPMLSSFAYSAPSTSATPSQIVILGMHHSGTSLLSNITMQMGAYGGEKDELLLHPDNPLKYWERRDVVALDEARLDAGVSAVSERYDLPSWVAYGFDAAKAAPKVSESAEAKAIVSKLNEKRPWVTKDPRMSLVAAEWMQLLDAPVCVIVHREPLSVANSMMIYSHNVSLAEWSSVYENYYASAMRACEGVPTVVVQHEEIVKTPYQAIRKMFDALVAIGVQGLTMPAEARVAALIKPSESQPPTYLASERQMVSANAQTISKALTAGVAGKAAAAAASWMSAPRRSNEAIATLLTTTNADYLRGALVLGSSIRSFDSSRDMIVLVTKAVPVEWRSALTVAGWRVVEVDELAEFWWGKSDECSKFDGDQAERWGHMATKLRLWQLTQYQRIMYLDADTVLTGPVAETFAAVTTFGAEKPLHHSHFNAGVMLLTPSETTFTELVTLGQQGHSNAFGNVIDCTEQGLLNSYYNGAAGREVTKLTIGRADVNNDWASTAAPFAVHWITHACPKPWMVADKDVEVPASCDPVVYTYWTRVWNRLTASAKDESSARSFGSREAARRKMRRLTGVSAGPSMVGGRYASASDLAVDVRNSIGRKLRQTFTGRRELRRRKKRWQRDDEYEGGLSEGTWAWIAIIGTLALGLGAGALLHKLFIKPPDAVGKGMTVVQAKRMGFQALGEGGPQGVVSAVDDDDDDDDDEEEEAPPQKKK